jgi:hypothetical protein
MKILGGNLKSPPLPKSIKKGMIGWARISPRFYNCGLLEGKGYKAFIEGEYNYSLSLWAVNVIR